MSICSGFPAATLRGLVASLFLAGAPSLVQAEPRELVDPLPPRTVEIVSVERPAPIRDAQPASPRALFTVGSQGNCDFASLQAAISSASDGDTIRVARSAAHLGQVYQVHGKGLIIQGGFDTCDLSETPNGRTTLDANNSSVRVFDIWQTPAPPNSMRVRLENLLIRRGSGGLLVEGQLGRLSVALENVEINNNAATTSGGGVRVLGVGSTIHTANPDPLLTVSNDSLIINNSAVNLGGGIHCSMPVTTGTQTSVRIGTTLIIQNSATNGGGLSSDGCRHMFVYSGAPFVLLFPTGGLYLNTATEDGGAILVQGGGSMNVSSQDFQGFGDPDHAAMIVGNEAGRGGAIAITGQESTITLLGTVVSGNSATADGGGVLVRNGASFTMRPHSTTQPCQPLQVGGGVAAQPPCSLFRQNEAGTQGGALRVLDGGQALVERTTFEDNLASGTAGAAVMVNRTDGTPADESLVTIESSLLTGNVGQSLIYAGTNSNVQVRWSTVAGNSLSASVARVWAGNQNSTSQLGLISSVVWDNGTDTLVTRGGSGSPVARADCLIGPQALVDTELSSTFRYSFIDPAFADPEEQDYRLAQNSPAIDYCDGENDPLVARDLAGDLRGEAWAGPPPTPAPNPVPGGIFDLGAYEAQFDTDVIFANGFE